MLVHSRIAARIASERVVIPPAAAFASRAAMVAASRRTGTTEPGPSPTGDGRVGASDLHARSDSWGNLRAEWVWDTVKTGYLTSSARVLDGEPVRWDGPGTGGRPTASSTP